MSACSLDGSRSTMTRSDRYGVTWKCNWCGGYAREEFDPRGSK